MPDLVEEYRKNPVGSLVTIRTQPWYFGNTLLIGDAAHAVVPFYGQGLDRAFYFKIAIHSSIAMQDERSFRGLFPALSKLESRSGQ